MGLIVSITGSFPWDPKGHSVGFTHQAPDCETKSRIPVFILHLRTNCQAGTRLTTHHTAMRGAV